MSPIRHHILVQQVGKALQGVIICRKQLHRNLVLTSVGDWRLLDSIFGRGYHPAIEAS